MGKTRWSNISGLFSGMFYIWTFTFKYRTIPKIVPKIDPDNPENKFKILKIF